MTRDLLKTVTFAVLHFSVAFGVAYALTGSVPIATGLALIEPLVNTIAFFFHERAWRAYDARQRPIPPVRLARLAPGATHRPGAGFGPSCPYVSATPIIARTRP